MEDLIKYANHLVAQFPELKDSVDEIIKNTENSLNNINTNLNVKERTIQSAFLQIDELL